ncbi:MAG: ABC transporter permease [Candidatus Kapaibacterium sp.]
MIEYIIKRVLLFIPTMIAITIIAFGISRLAPGDPAAIKAGVASEGSQNQNSVINAKSLEEWRKQMHLDKPILTQYGLWLMDILQLDFGKSFKDSRPVLDKIVERFPLTIIMNLVAVVLAYIIAVPIGVYSATHPNTTLDKILSMFTFAMYSLPTVWTATLAITFLCSTEFLYLFPTSGFRSDDFSMLSFPEQVIDITWHLLLPMLIYTYGSFAFISRQMRSAMLETVRQDYIRTARAKGLSEKVVIMKHAFRNSLIPIITLLAGILPQLIGGSVIVESKFSIPGMGKLSFEALNDRDYPMIMAIFTISGVLTLAGILLSDILYSIADPRIAYTKKSS